MIKKVYILGNHIQALGLARQVKIHGSVVILFTESRLSIARFSNSVKQTVIFGSKEDLFNRINERFSNEKDTLLFPTNDDMVDFLSENYSFFSDKFYLGIPNPEVVEIFYNKRNTYQYAMKYDIPVPRSWFPESLDDVVKLSREIQYPVIIKPAVMHTFHKITGKKAFKCISSLELVDKIKELCVHFPVKNLIIQEFLDGGAKSLYSYGAFAADGHAIAAVMANRIRQNPMEFGNSTTFAITCNIPEIKNYAEKILSLTNYFGLAEIEFMYDVRSGRYKFLEINTRAWKWHSISNGLGFGFISKMIDYFNNIAITETKDFYRKIAWVERLTDISVIIKEFLKGNHILKEAVSSYKIPKVYAVWSGKDILPFFMYLVLSPVLYFKRH